MLGKVSKVWNDVVEIEFPNGNVPQLDNILALHNNSTFLITKRIVDSKTVLAIVIKTSAPIKISDDVEDLKHTFLVPVGKEAKGNVYDILGNTLKTAKTKPKSIEMNSIIDGKKTVSTESQIIETGIKAIDFFMPILKGYKLGIYGGAGVGKTVLMKEIIFNINKNIKDSSSIFIGSGERSREGIELYEELEKSNLMQNSTIFISKMNEMPGARMSIVPMGLTAAEYLRDKEKEDVLLFIDNIFRFLQAGNEVSSSLGKRPSIGGYQATMDSDIAAIEDRMFKNDNGSITSFQTVFLPMDDLSDPSAVAIFKHLNGNLVLSRDQAAKNIFPSFDPLASSSASINEKLIGKRHFDAVIEAKKILKKYKDLEDVILILGFDELDQTNKDIVKKALQLENFFTQNFFMTEHFTKSPGQYVPLSETVESVIRILEGKYLKQSPEIFSYIGSNKNIKTDAELGL